MKLEKSLTICGNELPISTDRIEHLILPLLKEQAEGRDWEVPSGEDATYLQIPFTFRGNAMYRAVICLGDGRVWLKRIQESLENFVQAFKPLECIKNVRCNEY